MDYTVINIVTGSICAILVIACVLYTIKDVYSSIKRGKQSPTIIMQTGPAISAEAKPTK